MIIVSALLVLATPSYAAQDSSPCGSAFAVSKVVKRIADLPPEIRDDLLARAKDVVDPDRDFQPGDTADPGRRGLPRSRLAFAALLRNEWFVSIELGGPYRRVTLGYVRDGRAQTYRAWAGHFLGGDPCAVIGAALSGVTSLGPLGRLTAE